MKTQLLSLGLTACMAVSSGFSQEIATWSGFRSGAATFTFDDNCANQFSKAVPIFDKYGYKGSFYPVVDWGPNWSTLQTMVNNGHEVGSHSDSHAQTMPNSEIKSSKENINAKIKGQDCNTITYPNCNMPSRDELQKYYIGGRVCDGQVMGKTPSDYYKISSIICGSAGSVNSASAFESSMNSAIQKNGWAVFLIHEVDNGSGYSPTKSSDIDAALAWAQKNDSKIWVTTFRNAILYSKERNAAQLKESSSTANSVAYTLTDNLDDNIYNFPLSIKVPLPDGWSNDISVTQNEIELDHKISDGNVYFDAVPDAGTILLQSAAAITPDPTFALNFSEKDLCKDSTYKISWTMTGEASGTYSLKWNTASGSEELSVSSAQASSEWTNEEGTFSWSVDNILTDDGANGENSRWGAQTNTDEYVILNLSGVKTVGGVKIDEFTEYGSVTSFEIQYDKNGTWEVAHTGTSIGANFKVSFAPVQTSKVRLFIKSATGININYFLLTGVSGEVLKNDINGSGTFSWKPSITGNGTLTITKSSGKVLASSSAITVKECGSTGGNSGNTGGNSSNNCYVEGEGYTGPSCDGEGTGAYFTGVYRNLFTEYLDVTEEQVNEKINKIWNHFFGNENNKKVYYETNDGMAYIYDTGNEDVRTEGMSYGMMICVQLNKKTEFDKLWRWAKKYMQYKAGNEKEGLFAWQCKTSGEIIGKSCAPDGEAYFLTALWFASHRWGNDSGIDYEAEAQYLIKMMLDKPNRQAGITSPIFNLNNHLITFGETSYGFTDPSYNLPAFFELWARWTDTNKDFWAKTAQAARDLLYNAANTETGLYPDYSSFDGSPYRPEWVGYESDYYKYDAIRCPLNVGMDYHWFGTDSRQKTMMSNILNFFKKDGYKHGHFKVDGSDPSGNYSEGMAGANGVGVFAIEDEALAKEYINNLWNTTAPSGQWRYYNGMVYMMSMLHAAGQFRIYKPAPEVNYEEITGQGSVTYNGEVYTESTNICMMKDCEYYNINITVEPEETSAEISDTEESKVIFSKAENAVIVLCNEIIENAVLYDINGCAVAESETNTVSAKNLCSGVYILKYTTQSGKALNAKVLISK